MQADKLQRVLEAIIISGDKPLSIERLLGFFQPEDLVNRNDMKKALFDLKESFGERGFELVETSSGYRFQTKEEYKDWVTKQWDEKPAKYSRALLETLALIVYRQPISRAEIEDIRGVAVSSNIIKTLQERDWIRIVGHKEVPGRPSLLGTTRQFLDYFNLKSLDEMPSLSEIQDIDKLYPELDLKIQEELDSTKDADDSEDLDISKTDSDDNSNEEDADINFEDNQDNEIETDPLEESVRPDNVDLNKDEQHPSSED